MKNHSHKEPPLQEKVKQKSKIKSSISEYVLMLSFALLIGYTIAGVFE